ncbi:MAG: ornithine carbamoyltransferase [Chloroflexota bacterium]
MVTHFLSQGDFTADQIGALFERSASLKPNRSSNELQGRTLVMFFEKASTRTRLSFEIGMTQLGGHAVYLDRDSSQLSRGESIEDTALVVSRYADLLMARVFSHETISTLAKYSTIPVINGLSDAEHPCQSMADLFTMWEHKGHVKELRIAYVGDGNNNVAHSLLLGASMLGAHLSVASPPSLQPESEVVDAAEINSEATGGSVTITHDPKAAVEGADVIYTDVWVSMGREHEQEERLRALRPYQVNAALSRRARPDFVFMHCLPAHAGQEVTSEVLYGEHSVVFDQAENRLHVQKAIMLYLNECAAGGA